LSALVTDGKARLLATPKILVQSGEISLINVGESIPFIQLIDGKPEVNYIEAGVYLSVFPQTNYNGTITTYVQSNVSNLTAEMYQGYPSIQKRQANTVMTVHDGETIIIAGLVKENKSETVKKVPLLGDIPLVGNLFRSTAGSTKEVELIITLTQHIIK
jgi:type II secretory pathway component GspD/PulD (secretin)